MGNMSGGNMQGYGNPGMMGGMSNNMGPSQGGPGGLSGPGGPPSGPGGQGGPGPMRGGQGKCDSSCGTMLLHLFVISNVFAVLL